MKELPKVFHNKIDKNFNNNRSVYYSNNNYEEDRNMDSRTVLQKINDIFSSPNYVYKANVEITLKDKKVTKRIIGRNKSFIITMDNSLIPISDIIDIKSLKK
jgi:hypothetical protein